MKEKKATSANECVRTFYDPQFLMDIRKEVEKRKDLFLDYQKQLSALANPVRLKIAYILYRYGALCVCDLAEILRMNVSAISQHLHRMKEAKVVFPTQQGRTIFYDLNENVFDVFLPLFLSLKHIWKINSQL